ncbi:MULTISPECIES: hypothetical protein [unclassified Arthrobacter]|uniref:hypothetical protein n=1 Tax=unclassified Arthrobacter TaxID=235627 RepID=UPI001D15162D|nr:MULTISPECIES: hypothetical protein [unclassified Arthrobacter]MCC3277233.1 hypothetical protein [Arthrobacter sp. zg-Y20]MCC9179022.1 hypothetical protein [Arthrobacter sp. zg-Y750]MDK1317393.1 hypothetical protein [Arthrobacter sp. zg.Y20]MDK1328473.1 hypothetical protein [Arthrobacter sp. zg-Y1143]WIB07166.1 hypothetical protein QNO06_05440 [Arthrobacter sp. zg-Y20]
MNQTSKPFPGREPRAAALRRIVRSTRRAGRHLRARTETPLLAMRNARSGAPVTGTAPVVVSLTSYGRRLETVHLAIESIGRGSVRPRRLLLWVEDPRVAASPPAELARLQARGLELRLSEGYGPHTKYYPYVASTPKHTLPLVTADDDIIYPRHWLHALLRSYAASPDVVSCHWANRMTVTGGAIGQYRSWVPSRTADKRRDSLALGVSGVLYPPHMLDRLASAGASFRDLSPTADDIWLHWVALRGGVPVRQVSPVPRHFPVIPGSQDTRLLSVNVSQGRNDEWIRGLYTEEDIRMIEGAYQP